jgi:hypothetical protein
MKYLLIGGAVVAIFAYAWSGKAEANVYDMPVAETYAKLTSTKIEPGGQGAFGRLDTAVSGNGENVVYWRASGSHAAIRCQADLAPEGSKTRITAFCDGGAAGSGAAAGMLMGMKRKRLIEHIDATLEGRPYDNQLAMGSTAALWPADVRQPDGSFGTAVNDAIKMDRDMRQGMKEFEKLEKKVSAEYQSQMRSQMPSAATKPMTDLSN